jgi:outer membrane protein TolC
VSQIPTKGRRSRATYRLVLVVVFLTPLLVSPRSVEATDLTEEEFLAPFGVTHPTVLALTEELARAEGERAQAGTLENPTLEFEHEAPFDEADQTTFKLGWKPPLDGRRGLAIDASEAAIEAANRDLEWAQLQVRQDMRAIFADWAVAERRRALVARHFESIRELEARLNVRAERGEESQLAARRFALAVSQVRAELARTEAHLAQLRGRAMAVRDGLPPGATPVLPELPAVPSALGDSLRPDLLARRSEVEAATLRRRLAGRAFEFPTLIVGWTRISALDQNFDGPWVGFTWDAPIFNRNQGDQAESDRAIAIAQARFQLTKQDAAQRKVAALSAYATLHASLLEVVSVVGDASMVADAASASFLAGESSMTDLLDTLRSVMESQLAALDLQARALAAHRELELSAGRVLTQGDS